MKNLKVFAVLLCILLLSGCAIKNDVSLNIKGDGSLEYKVFFGMDSELLSNLIQMNNTDITEEEVIDEDTLVKFASENIKAPYLEGFTVEPGKNGEFYGNNYIYKVDDINKVSSNDAVKVNVADYENEEKLLKDQKLFSVNKDIYSGNFIFDLTVEDEGESSEMAEIEYFYDFSVTLPTKAISSNASSVSEDGKTLTWDLKHGELNEVKFEFRLSNTNMIIGVVACIVDIILLISIIIAFVYLRGLKK